VRDGKGKRNGARLPLLQQAVKLTKGCLYRWVMKRFDVQKNTRGANVIGSRAIRSRTSYLTVFSKRQIQHGQKVRIAAGTLNRWRPPTPSSRERRSVMVPADRLQGGLRIHNMVHVLPNEEWRIPPWNNVQGAQQVNEDKKRVSRVLLVAEYCAKLHVSENAVQIKISRG